MRSYVAATIVLAAAGRVMPPFGGSASGPGGGTGALVSKRWSVVADLSAAMATGAAGLACNRWAL